MFAVGVTVMVAVIEPVPPFIAVKAGTLPVPAVGKPIVPFEFVQVNEPPEGVVTKLLAGTAAPLQTTILAGTVTVGVGLMIMVLLAVAAAHPPEAAMVLVTVKVPDALVARFTCPVLELTKTKPAGEAVNTPALAPAEKVGEGFAAPWQ